VDAGASIGAVHRYYAFDADQNGAVIRAIVLDNSGPDAKEPLDEEQSAWLARQLEDVKAAHRPTLVFIGQPIDANTDKGFTLAVQLADAGVLAIVVAGDTNDNRPWPSQLDARYRVPLIAGGSLGYQRTQNNGVAWYTISVDVVSRQVSVEASQLALEAHVRPKLRRVA